MIRICTLVKYFKDDLVKTHLLDILKISWTPHMMELRLKICIHFLFNIKEIIIWICPKLDCTDNANMTLGKNESFMTYLLK